MTISTPEGVSLNVTLAGVGSRAGAAILDALIQGALLLVLAFVIGAMSSGDASDFPGSSSDPSGSEVFLIAAALINVVMFVVLFFYFVFFETLWSGRTPGKRAFGIRVVQLSGARLGFKASMVRNLLRIADLLPMFYLTGIITVVSSERNQRVGDMVAGTVVVLDRTDPKQAWAAPPTAGVHATTDLPEETRTWDVSAITGDDLAAVRSFLERRYTIPLEVRDKLAGELNSKLRPRVAGAQDWHGHPEQFLELLAAAKSARS